MEQSQVKILISEALKARENSYCPYSNYAVGAALLAADGVIYTGCNIENAAYTPTNCAERTAFFKAVSEGVREFKMIAIAAGSFGEPPVSYASPCGVCLQVMMEFCDLDSFKIITAIDEENCREYLLKELLPIGFGPENLK